MRVNGILSGAVAGCVALGLSAPLATADDNNDLVATVSPRTVRIGQTVHLTLRNCTHPGEGGIAEGLHVNGQTTARYPIDITDLTPRADGTLVGTTTINSNARPGTTETIGFGCFSDQDKFAEVSVTIVG